MHIFLDDERVPSQVKWLPLPDVYWEVARTPLQFQRLVDEYIHHIETISFDHDLQFFKPNGREITGYDCLKFLIIQYERTSRPLPKIYFHSKNVVGVENMKGFVSTFIKCYPHLRGLNDY